MAYSSFYKTDTMGSFVPLVKNATRRIASALADEKYAYYTEVIEFEIPGGFLNLEKKKQVIRKCRSIQVIVMDDETGQSVWGKSQDFGY